jgi:hypothetical protein
MPLVYGEGDKAFMRLQEEIMERQSGPESLRLGLSAFDQQRQHMLQTE